MNASRLLTVVAALLILSALVALALLGTGLVSLTTTSLGHSARLVPTDTLIYAQIPDGTALRVSYESSELKKIVENKDIEMLTGLLQGTALKSVKSVGGMAPVDFGEEIIGILEDFAPLLTGESFIAVTALDFNNEENPIQLVAGLKPRLNVTLSKVIGEIKAKLESNPDIKLERGQTTHAGVTYQWVDITQTGQDLLPIGKFGKPVRLCHIAIDGWEFTSIGDEAMNAVLDRLTPSPNSTGSTLADSPYFQEMVQRVGSGQQAIFYANARLALQKVEAAFHAEPAVQAVNTSSFDLKAWADGFRGVAGTMGFKGGRIENKWIAAMEPGASEKLGLNIPTLGTRLLNYTGPDTIGAYIASIDVAQGKFLDAFELSPTLAKALSGEAALIVDWGQGENGPGNIEGGIIIEVEDPTALEAELPKLLDMIKGAGETMTKMEVAGRRAYQSTPAQAAGLNLKWARTTVVIDGSLLGIFLNEQSAEYFLTKTGPGNVLQTSAFQSAGVDPSQAGSITFLDMGRIADNSYKQVRPMVQMMAMFSPDLNALSLPPELQISKHLGTFSGVVRATRQGYEYQAVSTFGDITMPILSLSGMAGLYYFSAVPMPDVQPLPTSGSPSGPQQPQPGFPNSNPPGGPALPASIDPDPVDPPSQPEAETDQPY